MKEQTKPGRRWNAETQSYEYGEFPTKNCSSASSKVSFFDLTCKGEDGSVFII